MIEKLDKKMEFVEISVLGNKKAECLDFEAGRKMNLKINELVDAVNELQKDYDNVCIYVGEQKLKNNTEKSTDPYAEQRKWIGHLVEYGNADDGFKYGILTNIEPIYEAFPFEIDNGRDATADCWLPSKSVFYEKD